MDGITLRNLEIHMGETEVGRLQAITMGLKRDNKQI